MEVCAHRHAPAALPPRKIPSNHCLAGWMGPRAGRYKYGERNKSCLTAIRTKDRPAPSDFLYRQRYPS
jgi:hypothetical protein